MTTLLRSQPVPRLPLLTAGMVLDVADWDGLVQVTVSGWDRPADGEQWVRGMAAGTPCTVRLFERATPSR